MPDGVLVERVASLESYMKDLSYQALKTERELAQLSAEMREFKDEMREFKDEMRAFKDEMREFKDEMLRFKDEMGAFKDEMLRFKDEMREFKDEMREFKEQSERDRREMNRRWGELANRMGTMVEDLVAPNLPRVARELFGCAEPEYFAVRPRKRVGPDTLELDALLVCEQTVLVNETKSSLNARDVDDLASKLEDVPRFFPELRERRVVGILASLYADPSLVRYATGKRILIMAMGDETMQILNPEAV